MAVVLIIGASQGIGLETVRCALAEGHRVRAFARGAASIAIDHPELEKVAGDALDRAAVSQALQGVDAVIEALGAPRDLGTVLWGTTLFSAATRILIDAMRAQGVAAAGGGDGPRRRRQPRPPAASSTTHSPSPWCSSASTTTRTCRSR